MNSNDPRQHKLTDLISLIGIAPFAPAYAAFDNVLTPLGRVAWYFGLGFAAITAVLVIHSLLQKSAFGRKIWILAFLAFLSFAFALSEHWHWKRNELARLEQEPPIEIALQTKRLDTGNYDASLRVTNKTRDTIYITKLYSNIAYYSTFTDYTDRSKPIYPSGTISLPLVVTNGGEDVSNLYAEVHVRESNKKIVPRFMKVAFSDLSHSDDLQIPAVFEMLPVGDALSREKMISNKLSDEEGFVSFNVLPKESGWEASGLSKEGTGFEVSYSPMRKVFLAKYAFRNKYEVMQMSVDQATAPFQVTLTWNKKGPIAYVMVNQATQIKLNADQGNKSMQTSGPAVLGSVGEVNEGTIQQGVEHFPPPPRPQ